MSDCKVIPVPKKYISENRTRKLIPQFQCQIEQWKPLLEGFSSSAEKIFGMSFSEGSQGIQIIPDENLQPESYVVDTRDQVQIFAADAQGCAYALATLLQLMQENGEIEAARIEDRPDKDYRSLMIDLAREWHPFPTLLHYVDLCFFYKIKYLHLHFMDDQSCTLPFKQFPALASKDRSYSKEEIRQLCDYAKKRGVVPVPEIEMPGHAKILNKAYPDVFANQFDRETEPVETSDVVFQADSVICVGSERTFDAVKKLIDDVLELFPDSPYIHLGADEVNTTAWKNCSVCREYMERNGIKNEGELFADFVGRVTDYVLSKGRRPIVWEGFAKEFSHKISKEVIVIAWESYYQYPDDLVEEGFDVINCAWKPLYIIAECQHSYGNKNLYWDVTDILKWNVYEWQHWWEKSAASLNPFHLPPTEQVLGAGLCSWEQTYECEIAEVVARLAALSERVWSVKRCCTDDVFIEKLRTQQMKAFRLIVNK